MAVRRKSLRVTALALVVLAPSLSGCAYLRREEQARVDQIQLQTDLERFTGVFVARLTQATEPLVTNDKPREVKTQALRHLLLSASAAIDIAAGTFPEVNLLDMLVFMELTSAALHEHWIPEVFGEAGRPLSAAFADSQVTLKRIAEGVLRPEQLQEVHQLVQAWRQENPGLRRVEWVRLFDFSEETIRVASERARKARGLMSSVQAATQSADQGLLVAERAVFLARWLPFVLRTHVRLAAQEILADSLAVLEETEALKPMLGDATTLAARAADAATDARALVDRLDPLVQDRLGPLLEPEGDLQKTLSQVERTLEVAERTLASTNHLADRSTVLLQDARADAGRLLVQLAALAALLVALFWGGYVVASRLAGS